MPRNRNDVARLAGVSAATVSYVINNGPRNVSEETRAKVLKAIEELGYRPNALARNLRRQATTTIAVVVPDTNNPSFPAVARGVERAAFERGFTVFLCHTDNEMDRELQYVDLLGREQVAGVIWVPVHDQYLPLEKLAEWGIPTVVVDRVLPDLEKIVSVVSDNFRGGYMATEHLIGLGHRRIAYVDAPLQISPSVERLQGYRAAFAEHEMACEEQLIVASSDFGMKGGRNTALGVLQLHPRPTAIFCYCDIVAIGVLRAASELGIRVPEELSVIGFDDIPQSAFSSPTLTTITNPMIDLGKRATDLLLDMIEKKEVPRKTVLDVCLMIRESTSHAP